ncbi:BRCA1-associated ATM activator 1 isoform X2 [Sceloporus undulatus]|uniref:BRCA1-associated ATM activator 1 isoform X2 n=1 Tax=Sceloporus undulatus TaxID=8520 RepID=UPI001C4BA688|nr:BRCA1-associated ATM activator 1 isoform X2 [Sceloporus undulatus]
MDEKCSQLLPSVCTILADPGCPVSDDTCLEKLLDWFKTLTSTGSSLLLLEENPCLTEMILAVLRQVEPNPNILSFILRLTGILAASETGFQHLQQGEVVFGAFGEAGALGSTLWEDMTIRSGWVLGAYTMLQHYSAFQFLCNSGALDVIFALQGDRSLFVASGASRLLARLLIFSVQSEPSRLLCTKDCDWPACARMIVTRVEDSLKSHPVSHVTRSLKLLTTLFEHNQDPWTEVLWSRIAETVGSLLTEEPVQAGHSLVELFLSMARSPAFSSPECSLWKLVTLALKNLILTQSGPLALGLLKLEACPEAIKRQALNTLLQPMDCISRAASDSLEFPSLLDQSSTCAASVESLLSSRASCVSLLCQTLAHLEEIQYLACSPVEVPHKPLLHSLVTVLQFCVGLAVPVSSLGATLGKTLVGCFRVQRAALGLLAALSQCATSAYEEAVERVFDILLVYLKSPDTSNTVLKKVFQATLKWFLNVLEAPGSTADFQRHQQFFREMLPVLQKRMCSPSWEVRDSALEYFTLVMKPLRGQEGLWQELLSSEVLTLTEGLLDDPESYVRASAVKALGRFSLVAGVDSKRPSSDGNGNHKEASSVGTRLLEILTKDTEGFPRRAVVGVFVEWLQEGHPDVLAAPELFVSKAIQAVSGDLDWEVKVAGLELAKVFAAQTFARFGLVECPYTAYCLPSKNMPPCLPELLQTFCRVKLFEFLFGALQDCDRPVCLKACQVLLAVKSKICKDSCLELGKRSELGDGAQQEEMPGGTSPSALIHTIGDSAEKFLQHPECLPTVLRSMDLEGLQRSLDLSSDHLERSPHSLLQDILSASGNVDENEADCY